jgi:hypothetical protein
MTPREVEDLTPVELRAFWRYFDREQREMQRIERQARARR